MKPEIKALLPELPGTIDGGKLGLVFLKCEIYDWLDKLTEGAEIIEGWRDTHTALLICPREVKKQTPLEIAVEALKRYESVAVPSYDDGIIASRDAIYAAREALAKIEAANGK